MIRWFVKGSGGGSSSPPTWNGRISFDTTNPCGYTYYEGWPYSQTGIYRDFWGSNNVEHLIGTGWWKEIDPSVEDEDWLDEGI